MEQFQSDLIKAKEISGYVKAKFGDKDLGILRLLCSVPYFRQAVAGGTLQQLTGMPLISFEKFLREQHQLVYRHDSGRFNLIRTTGAGSRVIGSWEDDAVFSVSGAVVAALRGMHPDGDSFSSIPLVSLGTGNSVDNILNCVDFESLSTYVTAACDANPDCFDDNTTDAIDNYVALVREGGQILPVVKYKAVEAVHRLYTQIRVEQTTVSIESELPACEPKDLMAVLCGQMKASVVAPVGGKLPRSILDGLKEAHPEGVERDGSFYLIGNVSLNPFEYIKSEPVKIEIDLDATPSVVSGTGPVGSAMAKQPCAAPLSYPQAPTVAEVGQLDPAFDQAVQLVLRYFPMDINSISEAEKEVAWFGFSGAKEIFKQIPTSSQKRLAAHVKIGVHSPVEVIATIAGAIKAALRSKQIAESLSSQQFALMAAGRVNAWKNTFELQADGDWRKLS